MHVLVVDDDPLRESRWNGRYAGTALATSLASDVVRRPMTAVYDSGCCSSSILMSLRVSIGVSVCRLLSRTGYETVPILMLTAREDVSDRVGGLEVGADDYSRQAVLHSRNCLARISYAAVAHATRRSLTDIWRFRDLVLNPKEPKANVVGLECLIELHFDGVSAPGTALCLNLAGASDPSVADLATSVGPHLWSVVELAGRPDWAPSPKAGQLLSHSHSPWHGIHPQRPMSPP